MRIENGTVISHTTLGSAYRVLVVRLPSIAPEARPGQFVHMRIATLHDAVLRRPFSIYCAEGETLAILYKTVGRGTEAMKTFSPGDTLSVMGPLGNGFPLPLPDNRAPILVAGGYGVAPLYFLARRLTQKGVLFIGGARATDILLAEEFRAIGWTVIIATEDGSLGTQGLVTVPLTAWLAAELEERAPEFFACGPNGMLKAVGACAIRGGHQAWLSLDRHMGCGVGACLACVQRVQLDGTETLVRVCKEGPIFESRNIVWGD